MHDLWKRQDIGDISGPCLLCHGLDNRGYTSRRTLQVDRMSIKSLMLSSVLGCIYQKQCCTCIVDYINAVVRTIQLYSANTKHTESRNQLFVKSFFFFFFDKMSSYGIELSMYCTFYRKSEF